MLRKYEHSKLAWIDLFEPTTDELREAMETYNIPPELMGDLSAPVPHSEAVSVDNTIKVTIDFPIVKRTDMESPHELKLIVMKQHLITTRYEDIAALHKFAKEFEVLSLLKKTGKQAHGGHLFVALMNALYDGLEQKLDYVETKMQDIDEGIFNEQEKEMVGEISRVSRRLITFRVTLGTHDEVLEESAPLFATLFNKAFTKHIDELRERHVYLMRRLEAIAETLNDLRETNGALLSTKQNEIMKILTIMAFITFPLTLMTSMFGMNTISTPIVGQEYDFWFILGLMSIATVGFFAYFKYKRWM